MVKKSAVILGILAMLALGVGMSWGYTVAKWPVPGIPNEVFCGGSSCLVGPEDCTLRGPVAPACEPPLVPGVIHAALEHSVQGSGHRGYPAVYVSARAISAARLILASPPM